MSSEPTNKTEFPHYFKKLPDGTTHVDVYHVLRLFEVTDAAIAHAVKKLLCAGKRGTKKQEQDLQEAGKSIARALEILSAEHYDGMSSAAGHHGYTGEVGEDGEPGLSGDGGLTSGPTGGPQYPITEATIDYNALGVSDRVSAIAIDSQLSGTTLGLSVRVSDKNHALRLMRKVNQYDVHKVTFRWTDHNAIWQELRQLSIQERAALEF